MGSTFLTTPALQKIYVDSTVELIADHFNLAVLGISFFLNASRDVSVNLPIGLKEIVSGENRLITHIKQGLADEWELTIKPNSITVNVRGRDPAAVLLDRVYEKVYIRPEYEHTAAGVQLTQAVQSQIDAARQTSILFPTGHTFEVGTFTASRIVRDAAASVGLSVSWEVRDYELQETFAASGRVIETIKKLVEPWTIVEPYRADILLKGSTLVIKHRQLPGQPLKADYGLTLKNMRRNELRVRKRFTRFISRLHLEGRLDSIGAGANRAVTGTSLDDADDQREVTLTTVTEFALGGANYTIGPNPISGSAIAGYIASPEGTGDTVSLPGPDNSEPDVFNFIENFPIYIVGSPGIGRTIKKSTYRLPQKVLLRETSQTFAPGLIEDGTTVNKYVEGSQGNLITMSTNTIKKFDENGNPTAGTKTTKVMKYDDKSFIAGEVTTLETLDLDSGDFSPAKMTVRAISVLADQMYEETTTEYVATPDSPGWSFSRRVTQTQAGFPPGGSGRSGDSIFVPNSTQTGAKLHVVKDFVLSTDPIATPFEYRNPNLSQADLIFLFGLFQAANQLEFELEVSFNGVSLPWLQKGMGISITNITDENGAAVNLPVLYVTEVRTTFDESKKDAEFVTESRAFAWI